MRIRSRGVPRFPLWLALCLALPSAASAAPQAPTPAEAAVAVAAAAPGAAALPVGEWHGTLTLDAQRLAAVRLVQRDGKARLLFGSPLNCALMVQAAQGGSFGLDSINGGAYCDRLMGKRLRVQRSGGDLRLIVDGTALPVLLHADPGQPSVLQGRWRAVAYSAGGNQVIALRVMVAADPQSPGAATVQVRYAEPRQCRLLARYVGMREQAALYSLDANNAGYCAGLSDGQLTLRPRSDGRVDLRVSDPSGARVETAVLERAPTDE